MRTMIKTLSGAAAILFMSSMVFIQAVHAEFTTPRNAQVNGGITATAQTINDSRVKNELLASVDLGISVTQGSGEWFMGIEGNTSLRDGGISTLLYEANGDAGTAVDRDNNGRFQVSELYYISPLKQGKLQVGLMDVTGILDTSRVANDETTQFLGAGLTYNATIEFPGYTLGLSYQFARSADSPMYTIFIGSSNGLHDNPNRSYSELVSISDEGKGAFAAAEVLLPNSSLATRLGIWMNSADHTVLSGAGGNEVNYGVYGSIDGSLRKTNWNMRLGMANDKVAEAARFLALAAEHPFSRANVGMGLARTWLSSKDVTPNRGDRTQFEAYARFPMSDQMHISPSVQWIRNSGFDSSNTVIPDKATIYSVRMQYQF